MWHAWILDMLVPLWDHSVQYFFPIIYLCLYKQMIFISIHLFNRFTERKLVYERQLVKHLLLSFFCSISIFILICLPFIVYYCRLSFIFLLPSLFFWIKRSIREKANNLTCIRTYEGKSFTNLVGKTDC